MSLTQTRSAIERFLSQDGNKVLAVRGDWGVGKTHLWRRIINDQAKAIHYKRYAYVSLFGVESLASLKEKIFQMSVGMSKAATIPSVESAAGNIAEIYSSARRHLTGYRKFIGWVRDVLLMVPNPIISKSGNFITNIAMLSIRNTLICLDDIERLGKGLKIEDVFGLISELKEAQDCSIVLLLNEDAFPTDIAKGYAEFRDKVVDMEVAFVPTPQDCVELAVPSDYPYYSYINGYVASLGITNIRIIKRCTALLDGLESLLKGREEAVVEETVKSIVLFCWCWFHRREGVPTLESVIAAGKSPYLTLFKESKDMTPEERNLREVLYNYGYAMNSPIDEPLAEYVRRGYYDGDVLGKALDERDAEAERDRSGQSFHSVFEQFYRSRFGNNEEGIVHAIHELIGNHGKNLRGYDLDQAMRLLRKLGRDNDIEHIVDNFIQLNKHRTEVFNISAYDPDTKPQDSYVVQRFNEVFVPQPDSRPVFDVALKMARDSGWHPADFELLSQQTTDDWYKTFCSTEHPDLFRVVSWLLGLNRGENGPTEWRKISTSVEAALRRIANQSNIDRLRVISLGIDPDNPTVP